MCVVTMCVVLCIISAFVRVLCLPVNNEQVMHFDVCFNRIVTALLLLVFTCLACMSADPVGTVMQVEALQEFGSQLNGARLNPNELQATLHLLGYLCSRTTGPDMVYLKTIRQAAGSTRAGSTGGRLLVPTADGRLVPAARAVHVTGGTGARLLGRTDPVHLTLVHPQLAEHVCR